MYHGDTFSSITLAVLWGTKNGGMQGMEEWAPSPKRQRRINCDFNQHGHGGGSVVGLWTDSILKSEMR